MEGINLGANKISYLVPKTASKEIKPSHPPAAVARRPARPYTPRSEKEKAYFRSLLDQLPPSELPAISDMTRALMDKNTT